MARDTALLAWQRWQIALAIRDGQWRTTRAISKLVGFPAARALCDDNGQKKQFRNFDKADGKWRLRKSALDLMERNEQDKAAGLIVPRKVKPRKKPKPRKKQKVRFK